jgi:hypothetical protein
MIMAGSVQASLPGPGTYIEPFNGSIGTWDRLDWVPGSLTDENDVDGDPLNWPDSVTFASGGGGANHIEVFEAYERVAVHLEVDGVPTGSGVRLDSVLFQGSYGGTLNNWGMGVGVYYDPNNWIKLSRARDAGGGLYVNKMEAGSESNTQIWTGYGFDTSWAMHGIELTSTQIKFYSSLPGAGVGGAVDQYNSLDFDGQMTLDLSAATIARPASFTGPATLLVGKGYAQVGGDPWDVMSDLESPKVVSIDSTRVILVPEPASLALILVGGLVAFAARRRRS